MFKTDNVMSVTNPPTKALIIDLFNFAGHMKSSTVKVHNEPVLHNLFTLQTLLTQEETNTLQVNYCLTVYHTSKKRDHVLKSLKEHLRKLYKERR